MAKDCCDQVEKMEALMLELMESAEISIREVKSGPYREQGEDFYSFGDSVAKFKQKILGASRIKVGSQVFVKGGLILGVVPDKLKEQKKVEVDLTSWEDIGGLKSQVDLIRSSIDLKQKHSSLAREYGVGDMKGILLYGPPGCGKTLVAKAVASHILKSKKVDPRAFVYVKGAELLSMWVGQTESRIKHIFDSCRSYMSKTGNRSIIFFDEADAIFPMRGSRRSSDVDKTIVPTFLSEMDGFEASKNPLVLMATNRHDTIDPAILREGRVDLKIHVKRPLPEDAEKILSIHFSKVKCAEDITSLSKKATECIYTDPVLTTTVSGAMMQTLVSLSARNAVQRHIDGHEVKGVTYSDISKSIQQLNQETWNKNRKNAMPVEALRKESKNSWLKNLIGL